MEFKSKMDGECSHALDMNAKVCVPRTMVQDIASKHNVKFKEDLEKVLDELKKTTNCDTQVCVVQKSEIDQSLIDEYFKPKGPKNSTAWLSNFDIDNVLKQLSKKFPDFLHIYFHMRDFQECPMVGENGITLSDLCFHSQYTKHGKKTFGVVFNTDKSSGKGEHWLAVFGDFRDPKSATIEYFDSAGREPMKEVNQWMCKVSTDWTKKFNFPIKPIPVSCMVYQNDNHSCGVYALYYIMSRLHGIEYTHFQKPQVNDAIMHDFRKYLFRE
jgi:hypothetical protein